MTNRLYKEEINFIVNDLESIICKCSFILLNTSKYLGYYNLITNPVQDEKQIETSILINGVSKYKILKLSIDKVYELLLSRDYLFAKYLSDFIVLKDDNMCFYKINSYLLAIQKRSVNLNIKKI